MNEFWQGVAAGLASTFIVVIIQFLIRKGIIPWFEELSYSNAKIEGEWISSYPEWQNEDDAKDIYSEKIILSRKGSKIRGTMTVISGGDRGTIFDFEGTFHNSILTATYKTQDLKSHMPSQ